MDWEDPLEEDQNIGESLYHIGINFLKTASEWLHFGLIFYFSWLVRV